MKNMEEDMVQKSIAKLVEYALAADLIEKEDAVWAANRLLALMKTEDLSEEALEEILSFDPSDKGVMELLPGILSSLC